MTTVIDTLKLRGFIEDTTHGAELVEYLSGQGRSCYIGFDPTASSLHVGSLVPIMSLAQMQRHGHRPIALVGGGTGLVGDPSGKSEMRQVLTAETVQQNAVAIKRQLSRFIDFSEGKALLLNNADWLMPINYIEFLRDIGRHFSVNRMIKAESYRMRLESDEGLSFIEFNYQLLQAYDFLQLSNTHDCLLQMGGSDQWGNIVAGIELIRRVKQKSAFGITFPLIMTSAGIKMGKTHAGAIWLDPGKTSPYNYYQYWMNTDDRDVVRFLLLYTFLPTDEIELVKKLKNSDLNFAKAILSYEATKIAHGAGAAAAALDAAQNVFGPKGIPSWLLPSSAIPREGLSNVAAAIPSTPVELAILKKGVPAFKLFVIAGLADSGGVARRLITQGGATINGTRVIEQDQIVTDNDLRNGTILLRAGKKRFHKIVID